MYNDYYFNFDGEQRCKIYGKLNKLAGLLRHFQEKYNQTAYSLTAKKHILKILLFLLIVISPGGLIANESKKIKNIKIWDTLSPFIDQVALQKKTGWKTVPAGTGREYSSKGDIVVENEFLTAVFSSKKGKVYIYTNSNSRKKRMEIIPLQLKGKEANITSCKLLSNTNDEAVIKVNFSSKEIKENSSAAFSFRKNQIIEVKPDENMKIISLLSPIEFGIVPSFISDDLIFAPGDYPSVNKLYIPSENLFLGLLEDENSMCVMTWPEGNQEIRLIPDNKKGDGSLFESIEFENNGKSFYLAVLDSPGIWHKEKLKRSYLEKDVTIGWKKPFPAKWITQFYEDEVKTTYRFEESNEKIWRAMIGYYTYPVRFEDENTIYHLGKKIPPEGESLIYFLEGKDTPVSITTPVDILKQTLDKKTFERILDRKNRQSLNLIRPNSNIDRDDLAKHDSVRTCPVSTCAITERLENIFKAGKEKEREEYANAGIKDMIYFITLHRDRINEYMEFARKMNVFLTQKKKSNPELKSYINKMETITQEIPREYNRLKEKISTLEYADILAQKTGTLTQKKDSKNLPTFLKLGKEWRGIGGAQDDLIRKFHTITRKLFQEAGYNCVTQTEALKIAKEIRERSRICLKNPSSYEIWSDY